MYKYQYMIYEDVSLGKTRNIAKVFTKFFLA